METTKFAELLADQIANEFAASQQYVAIAVWLDDPRRWHEPPAARATTSASSS